MSNYLLADLLSALKNYKNTDIGVYFYFPYSIFCARVLDVLKNSGYIQSYEVTEQDLKKQLKVFPRFNEHTARNMFSDYKLISKPSVRLYCTVEELKNKVFAGRTRTFVLSTSKGVLSSDMAIKMKAGGELLFVIL